MAKGAAKLMVVAGGVSTLVVGLAVGLAVAHARAGSALIAGNEQFLVGVSGGAFRTGDCAEAYDAWRMRQSAMAFDHYRSCRGW